MQKVEKKNVNSCAFTYKNSVLLQVTYLKLTFVLNVVVTKSSAAAAQWSPLRADTLPKNSSVTASVTLTSPAMKQ